MKKLSLFFNAMLLTLLFAGCQTSEEELTLDSFKATTTIQGNVYYSTGQEFVNNYIVDKQQLAAGKNIYLDIQSSEYKPGSTGVISYSAVIDAQGGFKFIVPVKSQGNTSATLRLEQFESQRSVYEKMTTNSPQFKQQKVVYSFTQNLSLTNGKLSILSINYNYTPIEIPEAYTDYIKFSGKLNTAYETGFRAGAFRAAAGKSVDVQVNYPELGGIMHFGTTVDQNGNYSIQIPVSSRKKSITATFQPLSYYVADYEHYTSSADKTVLNGIYGVSSNQSVTTKQDIEEVIDYTVKTMNTFFTPTNIVQTFTTQLAGWSQPNPDVYLYPITLTGYVYNAVEKSYLSGEYAASSGKKLSVTINMGATYGTQTFDLATDNAGKYVVPLVLPEKNMNLTVSVNVDSWGVTNYTHYMSNGTSANLTGWYTANYYSFSNKIISINEFSTSYNLESIYKTFTPLDLTGVKDWNTNLIGWHQIYGKKGVVNIIGGIKQAVEGAPNTATPATWANASWTIAPSQPFDITVSSQTFKGITTASGQYSIYFPVNYVVDTSTNSTIPISLTSSVAKVTNFVHYSSINAAATTIQGSYNGSVASTNVAIVNGNCLLKDCYMYFIPTTTPTGWSSYIWTNN